MSMPQRAGSEEATERAERDLRLIAAYRAGRERAFDELVRTYEPTVQRLLVRLNAAQADVEDLTQEVFLRVYRNLDRFRAQSSFYTWLYRVTVNVFFDHNKKRKRADVRLARLQSALSDATGEMHDAVDPFHATLESLTRQSLDRAIALLPPPFREVVALRELDDLSYEEIAVMAGVSVGTVRSRLSRARSRLKESLRPLLTPEAA